ncbi:MAG TPA: thioredoxin domain-containing protein, partial [Gammaproteobacteria bacterium]|nr:thioredoxin domain-containing protein [Gammaproteobacteria bacterium]
AEGTLRAAWSAIEQAPSAHCALLLALEEHLYPPQILILRGAPETLWGWQDRTVRPYAPRRLTLAIPDGARDLPGLLAERGASGQPRAYLCTGTRCAAPVDDLQVLEPELQAAEAHGGGS